MADESSTADVAAAMAAIRRLVRVLRVSSRASERDLGVSGAQLFVLQKLAERPAQSISDLAARTATDPSSVSVVVSRLVEAGFAARKVSKSDARRAEVVLAAPGRALLRKSATMLPQARMVETLDKLPPSKLRGLLEGLDDLVKGLGLENEPAPMFFEEEDRPKKKVAR